ncbi:PIN domain-containing protein [Haloarchaeobius salinus]|uniref:PIN domain-containing protein n=1 Tax=Haloarchaeobius salinus TaxID=1198298 RepID=UPI00210BB74F|nr:PIN domain-containing protein [Haloarchaeobius salinus]
MSTRVVLDTSALMMPVELDVRLFDELDRLVEGVDPVAPQAVVEELRRLSEKGGEEGTAANVGHDLVTERCLVVDTEESYADDAIVELAREGHAAYVVTNDLPLRDRVLDAGVPVIALRGKNKLAVTQP